MLWFLYGFEYQHQHSIQSRNSFSVSLANAVHKNTQAIINLFRKQPPFHASVLVVCTIDLLGVVFHCFVALMLDLFFYTYIYIYEFEYVPISVNVWLFSFSNKNIVFIIIFLLFACRQGRNEPAIQPTSSFDSDCTFA